MPHERGVYIFEKRVINSRARDGESVEKYRYPDSRDFGRDFLVDPKALAEAKGETWKSFSTLHDDAGGPIVKAWYNRRYYERFLGEKREAMVARLEAVWKMSMGFEKYEGRYYLSTSFNIVEEYAFPQLERFVNEEFEFFGVNRNESIKAGKGDYFVTLSRDYLSVRVPISMPGNITMIPQPSDKSEDAPEPQKPNKTNIAFNIYIFDTVLAVCKVFEMPLMLRYSR